MDEEMVDYDSCNDGSKEDCWSVLPFLLLWMIKDRLDFIDNVQLAAVCRNWYFASASYTKKSLQSAAGDRLPWIMQYLTVDSSLREFICVSRRKKFTIDLPEFYGATTLFSKQGWLLLRRKNFSVAGEGEINRLPDSVFLMNPFTKAKIKMPDLGKDTLAPLAGSFSTTIEGYPHCVVLRGGHFRQGPGGVLTLRVAYVGDKMWSQRSFAGDTVHGFDLFNGLLIHGQLVCCFDLWGLMVVYNMATHEWKEIRPRPMTGRVSRMMEKEGEIMRIDREGGSRSVSLFRYNASANTWENLNNMNDVRLKDISCLFLQHRFHFCFSSAKATKEEDRLKKKVCFLHRIMRDDCGLRRKVLDVKVQDLVDGSTQMLLPFSCYPSATWVDMG